MEEKKENLHLNDLFTGSVMEKVDKTIKYIQNNAGAISLIFTVAITLGSVLIKFMYYLSDLGYSYYFGTSKESIDVSSENIIYSFFADGVIALFVLLLNFISYQIWKKHRNRIWKLIHVIVLVVLVPVLLIMIEILWDYQRDIVYTYYEKLIMLIGMVTIFVLVFLVSFYWQLMDFVFMILKNKQNKKNSERRRENLKNKNIETLVLQRMNVGKMRLKNNKLLKNRRL